MSERHTKSARLWNMGCQQAIESFLSLSVFLRFLLAHSFHFKFLLVNFSHTKTFSKHGFCCCSVTMDERFQQGEGFLPIPEPRRSLFPTSWFFNLHPLPGRRNGSLSPRVISSIFSKSLILFLHFRADAPLPIIPRLQSPYIQPPFLPLFIPAILKKKKSNCKQS